MITSPPRHEITNLLRFQWLSSSRSISTPRLRGSTLSTGNQQPRFTHTLDQFHRPPNIFSIVPLITRPEKFSRHVASLVKWLDSLPRSPATLRSRFCHRQIPSIITCQWNRQQQRPHSPGHPALGFFRGRHRQQQRLRPSYFLNGPNSLPCTPQQSGYLRRKVPTPPSPLWRSINSHLPGRCLRTR